MVRLLITIILDGIIFIAWKVDNILLKTILVGLLTLIASMVIIIAMEKDYKKMEDVWREGQ